MEDRAPEVEPGLPSPNPVGAARRLRMAQSVYHQIRSHAESAYPEECCGALLGLPTAEGWLVTAATPAANSCTEDPGHRYQIDPSVLVGIESNARSLGLEIAGFYHSHPDHGPHWSAKDLAEAHWIGCSYVITAVVRGTAAQTLSFLLAGSLEQDKRFEPETIEFVEDRADARSMSPGSSTNRELG